MPLPPPSAEAQQHSDQLCQLIRGEIAANGGRISFARYMELALYAPGLGYYNAGARKLGASGDFLTAPELSPLFGRTLAQQAKQILEQGYDQILEIGAGSGALAAALLEELERLGRLPRHYHILEISPDLRQRSRDRLAARVPHLLERVAWLNQLPPAFSGLIIGNEVLDAMPVNVVVMRKRDILEADVQYDTDKNGLGWHETRAPDSLREAASRLNLPADNYRTEIGLAAQGFLHSLASTLQEGVALFIDYGFPAREYYHPQRSRGTLMCHYRHHAHADPFFLPGLQDITSHVDFSAIARAGVDAGLSLLGYTGQAQFLINCGITEILAEVPPDDAAAYLPLASAAQKLLSPAEMGELFKVLALGKGFTEKLLGFARGDKSGILG
ncbi:MAG TPA: SAM-dependent methyltransferase [Burkholderiales bacterium]|nr:SAM-dependent methyltransferase [Burkholderiales bacterium]